MSLLIIGFIDAQRHFLLWFQVLENDVVILEDVDTPPGSGPRHLNVDESRGLLYVLYELKSLIEVHK